MSPNGMGEIEHPHGRGKGFYTGSFFLPELSKWFASNFARAPLSLGVRLIGKTVPIVKRR